MALSFDELLAEVERHNVEVDLRLRGIGNDDPLGEYDPPLRREVHGVMKVIAPAKIWFYRDDPGPQRTDSDVCTLAHEFGHHERWASGEREEAYQKFIEDVPWPQWASGVLADRQRVLAEETSAWDYAEKTLRRLGFTAWETYRGDREAALAEYRKRLAL